MTRRFFALLLLGGCAPALVAPPETFAPELVRRVAPGVTWSRFVSAAGPWRVNLVRVDLRRRELGLEAAHADDRARGRERTSAIARRHRSDRVEVLAAINADFFDLRTGEVQNNLVIGGAVVKGVPVSESLTDAFDNPHAHFGVTRRGVPVIGRFALAAWLEAGARRFPLAAVNARPGRPAAALVLYNRWAGPAVRPDSAVPLPRALALRPIRTRGDTSWLESVWDSAGGDLAIPRDGYLLAGYDTAATQLAALTAAPVTLLLRFTPDVGPLRTLVGGWGMLVEGGRLVADSTGPREGTPPSFSVTRHPRSGIGIARDGRTVLLVTVDGRSDASAGMSLVEFGKLMLELGAWHAMNLDGGGSTTLLVGDSLANHPSDAGGERPVGNALLLVRRRP